jgi:hypothetical protein
MGGLREISDSTKSDDWWDDFYQKHLDSIREEFEAGEVYAIFRAIAFCGNEKIIIPEWAVQALYDGMRKYAKYEVATFDEAFGFPPLKGKHLDRMREKRRYQLAVYQRVNEYLGADWKIGNLLFETVADEFTQEGFKIGKTKVWEYFDEMRDADKASQEKYSLYYEETGGYILDRPKNPKKPVPGK